MRNNIIIILLLVALSACYGKSKKIPGTTAGLINNQQVNDTGIIYFSFDNGKHWQNASTGLPQNLSIGLGSIAVTDTKLALTSQEYGVYIYNTADSAWMPIPTAKAITDGNPGAMLFFNNAIYIGTQHNGVFYSADEGKTWSVKNNGLTNLSIRRFIQSGNSLYVCTNDGFYVWNDGLHKWMPEYGCSSLQVNGATVFKGSFYLATSKGVYTKDTNHNWKNLLPNRSVHNISSDNTQLYAMTYDDLLLTSLDGITWISAQEGLPRGLYTFNILNYQGILFAGQWDGVYRKQKTDKAWTLSRNGLPASFAAINLQNFNGVLVVSTAKRKLKTE